MPKPIEDIDIGDVDPAELTDRARERGIFIWDLETTGLNAKRDRIEGVAFYVPEGDQPPLRAWYPFVPDTFRTWVQPDETPEEQAARLRYERTKTGNHRAVWKELQQKPVIQNLRPAMPQARTMNALRPLFERSPGTVAVAHNLKFDFSFMRQASGCEVGYWEQSCVDRLAAIGRGEIDPGPRECGGLLFADSMLADFLSDETHYQYGLKKRVKDLFGHEMTTYMDVMRHRKQSQLSFMADEPGADSLGHYAMDDCLWTWRLFEDRMRELDHQTPGEAIAPDGSNPVDQLADVVRKEAPISPFDRTRRMGNLERIFWGIDMKICLLLEEMESTGILIDWEWLRVVTERLEGKKAKIIEKIERRIGWTLNPNSTDQVAALLFSPKEHGGLGLRSKGIKRGKSGAISTGSKEISHLGAADPIVTDVLDWRSADTIQANFSVKLAKLAQEEPDGRIYSHFNQTGTKIYRLSCISGSSKLSVRVGDDVSKRSIRISELLRFSGQPVTIETHKGRERRITHLINKGPGFMFDVETDDGRTIRCTAEHRFLTERGWRALKDIRIGDRLVRAEVREAPAAGGRPALGAGPAVVSADLRGGRAGGALEDPRLRAVERDCAGLQGGLRLGVPAPVPGNADEAAGIGRDPARVPDVCAAGALQGVRAFSAVVPDRVCGQRSHARGGEGAVRHRAPVDDPGGEALPGVLGPAQGQAGTAHQRAPVGGRGVLSTGGAGASPVGRDDRGGDRERAGRRVIAGPDGSEASWDHEVERERFSLAGQPVAAGVGRAGAGEPGDGRADRRSCARLPGAGGDLPTARGAGQAPQGKLGDAQDRASTRRAAEGSADLRLQQRGDAVIARTDGGGNPAPASVLFLQELAGGLRVAGGEADGRGRWRISPEVRDDQGERRPQGEEGPTDGLPCPALHDRAGGSGATDCGASYRESAWLRVASIAPAGVEPVWDITVEEDASYVAHGFLNHNSSNPVNLQNQPTGDELIRKAFCARLPDPSEDHFKKLRLDEMALYERLVHGMEIGELLNDPTLQLYSADYSQIELRVAAHLSGDKGMIEVYQTGHPCTHDDGDSCERYKWWECKTEHDVGGENVKCGYTWVPGAPTTCSKCHGAKIEIELPKAEWRPKTPGAPTACPKCSGEKIEHQERCRHVDLHTRTAEDANVPRNPLAKNLNFGVLYRIGALRFCQYANLYDKNGEPRVEYAEQVIKAWFAAYPDIHPFHLATEASLKSNGWYACTLTGRRRRLDKERWKNEYRAVTQGIQFQVSGSAQDILKRAMIDIAIEFQKRIARATLAVRRLWKKVKLILQVHDEITYVGPVCLEHEIIEIINTKMAGAATLKVPIPANCKAGRTWQHVH